MAIKVVTKKPASAVSSVVHSHKGEVVTEHNITEELVNPNGAETEEDEFKATVGIETSSTINLGNYNSLRVGVSLTIQCPIPALDETAEFIEGWVNQKMESLTSEVEPAEG